MSNYFNPEDVITAQGVVSNITRNGAGFISTKDGVDVFVPIRLTETSGIEMGDSVTVYMVKNFGDSSLKNISDSATYRALRVVINTRLGVEGVPEPTAPVMPQVEDVLPAPAPSVKAKLGSAGLRSMVDKYFADGFTGTSAMLHSRLVQDLPDIDMMGDDAGLRIKMDISSLLHRLHDEGLIAQARICTSGDQKNSSYTVYGPTAKGLFHAIIGA
jgi:cold shock CspA family protein